MQQTQFHPGERAAQASAGVATPNAGFATGCPTSTAVLAFGATSALAAPNDLTVCDPFYLELALRLGLPLASLDVGLRQAALSCGVRLAIMSWP